jgi:hypothetical protein
MWPEFANPFGLWALLGVPAVLAIHFFQQRSRVEVVSTLFLIEPLAPQSRAGRRWERLRWSRELLLQLLAVLLAAWVLAEPRWVRAESAQTIVIVLDDSASMAPFREPASRAVASLFAENDGRAARTEWLLLRSDPRATPLYRGTSRTAALAALAKWEPARGAHDLQPALRLAQSLAGANGLTWLVTDSRAKVPAAQPAIGVGRPLANVGFAGATVTRENGVLIWRALVQNHTDAPARRTWTVEAGEARTPPQTLELAAGALLELSGRLPDGVERCTVALEPDEFAADDRLPLVRPAAKALAVRIDVAGETGAFFRKVLGTVDGVTFPPAGAPQLRVVRRAPDDPRPTEAAIVVAREPAESSARGRVLRAPVVVEKHALLADLNWQGWLGSGPGDFSRQPSDQVLLWQNERPLAWVSGGVPESRRLFFNFDWETSNAVRLPAAMLLVRRHAESVRDAQTGPYVANFDTGAAVALAPRDRVAPATLEFQPASGAAPVVRSVELAELAALRAPAQPGFFVLRRGDDVLVRGTAQFADPRVADFRAAETFSSGRPPEARELFLRNSLPDPFVAWWLALIGACLIGSWWPRRRAADALQDARAT